MVTEIREIRPKIAVEKVLEDRAVIAKEVREELEAARRIKEKNDLLEEGIIMYAMSMIVIVSFQQLMLLSILQLLLFHMYNLMLLDYVCAMLSFFVQKFGPIKSVNSVPKMI